MKLLSVFTLLPFVLSALSYTYNPDHWMTCNEIHVTKNSPSQEDLVLWMNTYSQPLYPVAENYPFPGDWSSADRWMEKYGWCGRSYPDNEWVTATVSDRVPEGTKAIYLTGLMLVSYGNADIPANMTLTFRRKGDLSDHKYVHQACITKSPECSRNTMSLWVPLDENREFEFRWTRSTFGQWPEEPAYGICLSLNAWAK